MINMYEVSETNKMIEHENLDVRTITLGISLLDCIDSDLGELNRRIYEKITATARNLVETGREIEKEFGIPIVNKRSSSRLIERISFFILLSSPVISVFLLTSAAPSRQ